MPHDIVVVGGGPAGSSAAHHLARRGYDVVLIDRQDFPRDKACGDGLTPRALAALERMGLARLWAKCYRIDGLRIVDQRDRHERERGFTESPGQPGFGGVLTRYELDAALCRAAADAGAKLWTGTTALGPAPASNPRRVALGVRRGQETRVLESRFVVVAEGSAGRLAVQLNGGCSAGRAVGYALRQYYTGRAAVGRFFEVHLPLTVGNRPLPGYGWMFPVSETVVNVGVGFVAGGRWRANLRLAYFEFVERLRSEGRLDGLEASTRISGAPLNVGLVPEEVVGPGFVLAGDAAGLVSPFTGEGIAHALESGELAAEAVHEALAGGRLEARTYRESLGRRFRRHEQLRGDLSAVYGLARLYQWSTPRGTRGGRGTIASCLRRLVWDMDREPVRGVGAVLLGSARGAPAVEAALRSVEDDVLAELARVSPLLAETSYYTIEHRALLSGCAAAVLLACASAWGASLDDTARLLALVAELSGQAFLFQSDVDEQPGARFQTALAILMADAVVARTYDLLGHCERGLALDLSTALTRESSRRARHALSGRHRANRAGPTAAFVAELAGILFRRPTPNVGPPHPAVRWTHDLLAAAQTLHDVWPGPGALRVIGRPAGAEVSRLRRAGQRLARAWTAVDGLPAAALPRRLTWDLRAALQEASQAAGLVAGV